MRMPRHNSWPDNLVDGERRLIEGNGLKPQQLRNEVAMDDVINTITVRNCLTNCIDYMYFNRVIFKGF